jgi:hypothetical protein
MLGGPPDVTDKFQAIIIDRSDIAEGDFDLQMNYGPINWESPPVPPASSGQPHWLDWSWAKPSSISTSITIVPVQRRLRRSGKITTPGSIFPPSPFVCNNITVEFRDGVGTLVGFVGPGPDGGSEHGHDQCGRRGRADVYGRQQRTGRHEQSISSWAAEWNALIDAQPDVGTAERWSATDL